MPINEDNKLLFIHIPKTAGSSIEHYFDMRNQKSMFHTIKKENINGVLYAPQHLPFSAIKEEYKTNFTSFTIVRHPYDRVLSEYFYDTKETKFDKLKFKNWLSTFYANQNTDHKMPQYHFLAEKNKIMVNYILRYEFLKTDFKEFLDIINYPIRGELGHDKVGSKRTLQDSVSLIGTNEKEFIYKLFEIDFIKLNYNK